jgi:hypothetical protein
MHLYAIRLAYVTGDSLDEIARCFIVDRVTVFAALRGGPTSFADELQDRIDLRLVDDTDALPLWMLGSAVHFAEPNTAHYSASL